MNFFFSFFLFLSVLLLLFKEDLNFLSTISNSIENSLSICLSLGVIYIFWCGILEIIENLKIGQVLAKILSPILKKIFPNLTPNTYSQISLNLSTNMLGIGNASLPAGLSALNEINAQKTNKTQNANLLIILNCISLQIVPTTVMSLYFNAGGKDFFILWLFGIAISLTCFFLAIFLNKTFKK